MFPARQLQVRIISIDNEDWKKTEVESVDVRQTIGDLKQTWSKRLNVAVSKLRLFFVDMEVESPHEITGNAQER